MTKNLTHSFFCINCKLLINKAQYKIFVSFAYIIQLIQYSEIQYSEIHFYLRNLLNNINSARISRLEVFHKVGVLKNFAKFTGNYQGQQLYQKRDSGKFLRTPFLQNTFSDCFCSAIIIMYVPYFLNLVNVKRCNSITHSNNRIFQFTEFNNMYCVMSVLEIYAY